MKEIKRNNPMNNQQTDYKAECMKIYYASDVVDKTLSFGCELSFARDNKVYKFIRMSSKFYVTSSGEAEYSKGNEPEIIGHSPTLASWLQLIQYKNPLMLDVAASETNANAILKSNSLVVEIDLTTEEPTDWESLYNIIKT